MKSKLFVLSLIVATGLFSSCKTEEPTETDWNNYVAALKHYYPYSLEDQFLFVNDSLGRTWEAQPYDDTSIIPPYTNAETITTSGNIIINNDSTIFEASESVTLNGGFIVPLGKSFTAEVKTCE